MTAEHDDDLVIPFPLRDGRQAKLRFPVHVAPEEFDRVFDAIKSYLTNARAGIVQPHVRNRCYNAHPELGTLCGDLLPGIEGGVAGVRWFCEACSDD